MHLPWLEDRRLAARWSTFLPSRPTAARPSPLAIKVNHYPTQEKAGILWVWLGKEEPAPFPNYNWMDLPQSHIRFGLGMVNANWLNGLEGQLDSAHVGILHQDWATKDPKQFGKSNIDNTTLDLAPRFEFEEQPYGFREAAVRNMPDGQHYVRVREFVMPWYSYIPQHGGREGVQLLTISVPVDDETSIQWDLRYNLVRPMTESNWPNQTRINDMTAMLGGPDKRYGQDREMVKAGKWSGFKVLRHEDYAVAVAQGNIADRAQGIPGLERHLHRARAPRADERGQEKRRRRKRPRIQSRDRLGQGALLRRDNPGRTPTGNNCRGGRKNLNRQDTKAPR